MASYGLSLGMMYVHLTGSMVKVGTADQNLLLNLLKLRSGPRMGLIRSTKQFKK